MARWGWVAFRAHRDASRGSREMWGAGVVVDPRRLGLARGTTLIASSKNGPSIEGHTRGRAAVHHGPWRRRRRRKKYVRYLGQLAPPSTKFYDLAP
jgi:hypothetical protein